MKHVPLSELPAYPSPAPGDHDVPGETVTDTASWLAGVVVDLLLAVAAAAAAGTLFAVFLLGLASVASLTSPGVEAWLSSGAGAGASNLRYGLQAGTLPMVVLVAVVVLVHRRGRRREGWIS